VGSRHRLRVGRLETRRHADDVLRADQALEERALQDDAEASVANLVEQGEEPLDIALPLCGR
jgi:hypothetical protein